MFRHLETKEDVAVVRQHKPLLCFVSAWQNRNNGDVKERVCAAPAGFYYNYVTHSDELRLLPSKVHSCRHVPVQQKSPQAKFNT